MSASMKTNGSFSESTGFDPVECCRAFLTALSTKSWQILHAFRNSFPPRKPVKLTKTTSLGKAVLS